MSAAAAARPRCRAPRSRGRPARSGGCGSRMTSARSQSCGPSWLMPRTRELAAGGPMRRTRDRRGLTAWPRHRARRDRRRRIRVGQPEGLRLRERGIDRQFLLLHAREDEVAGAIQDAGEAVDFVGAMAQMADDGQRARRPPLRSRAAWRCAAPARPARRASRPAAPCSPSRRACPPRAPRGRPARCPCRPRPPRPHPRRDPTTSAKRVRADRDARGQRSAISGDVPHRNARDAKPHAVAFPDRAPARARSCRAARGPPCRNRQGRYGSRGPAPRRRRGTAPRRGRFALAQTPVRRGADRQGDPDRRERRRGRTPTPASTATTARRRPAAPGAAPPAAPRETACRLARRR